MSDVNFIFKANFSSMASSTGCRLSDLRFAHQISIAYGTNSGRNDFKRSDRKWNENDLFCCWRRRFSQFSATAYSSRFLCHKAFFIRLVFPFRLHCQPQTTSFFFSFDSFFNFRLLFFQSRSSRRHQLVQEVLKNTIEHQQWRNNDKRIDFVCTGALRRAHKSDKRKIEILILFQSFVCTIARRQIIKVVFVDYYFPSSPRRGKLQLFSALKNFNLITINFYGTLDAIQFAHICLPLLELKSVCADGSSIEWWKNASVSYVKATPRTQVICTCFSVLFVIVIHKLTKEKSNPSKMSASHAHIRLVVDII